MGTTLLTTLIHNPAAAVMCLSLVSASYFVTAITIWTTPPNYLKGEAAAGRINVINSPGQVGVSLAPIMLGWVKTVMGSFSAGVLLVAVLVFTGGITVLFGALRQQQAPRSGV